MSQIETIHGAIDQEDIPLVIKSGALGQLYNTIGIMVVYLLMIILLLYFLTRQSPRPIINNVKESTIPKNVTSIEISISSTVQHTINSIVILSMDNQLTDLPFKKAGNKYVGNIFKTDIKSLAVMSDPEIDRRELLIRLFSDKKIVYANFFQDCGSTFEINFDNRVAPFVYIEERTNEPRNPEIIPLSNSFGVDVMNDKYISYE